MASPYVYSKDLIIMAIFMRKVFHIVHKSYFNSEFEAPGKRKLNSHYNGRRGM